MATARRKRKADAETPAVEPTPEIAPADEPTPETPADEPRRIIHDHDEEW